MTWNVTTKADPTRFSPAPGVLIQTGTTMVTFSAASAAAAAVTFASAFSATPRVTATSSNGLFTSTAYSQSPTGFTVGGQHRDGTATTTTVTYDWIAIGAA
ncbi:hypothetical protein [Nocardioides sp.]|uniref:hypothetical protein n=1 Tax=Nocardioides sp. TaxID=35761 RepID=UPI002613E271|nr:hypothetical protein [Nocardioides sp.]